MASLIHEPERPRKPWRVDFSTLGRRQTKRFAAKREAEAFIGDLARGRRLGMRSMRLNEWVPEWITTHGPEWEPRTQDDRTRYTDDWILPWLGKARISEITRVDVRGWRAAIVASGATPYVAQAAVRVLSACLGDAFRDDIIQGNPCVGLTPLSWERQDRDPWTLEEVERIRRVMESPHDQAAVSLMAYCGVRPSELVRVTWADVREATAVIRRGARTSGGTKTESVRTVPIIRPVRDDLSRLDRNGGTIFRIPSWDNWTMRTFRPARVAVGVDRTPYALRHTAASLWIAEGRTMLEVAQLLGHSTPRLTMDTYGHLFGEAQLRPNESAEKAAMRARRHEARRKS